MKRRCTLNLLASRLSIAILAAASWSVSAVCLNPFGCEPKNYDECVAAAAAMPTPLGVTTAKNQCYAKFKRAQDERERLEDVRKAESLSALWARIGQSNLPNEADFVKAFGQPSLILGPENCPRKTSDDNPGFRCYTLMWKDNRPGRMCLEGAFGSGDCHFKALALNNAARTVVGWWPDSF